MPIRKALGGLLSDATSLLVDTALRDVVEEILDSRDLVRRADLAVASDRLEIGRASCRERV